MSDVLGPVLKVKDVKMKKVLYSDNSTSYRFKKSSHFYGGPADQDRDTSNGVDGLTQLLCGEGPTCAVGRLVGVSPTTFVAQRVAQRVPSVLRQHDRVRPCTFVKSKQSGV